MNKIYYINYTSREKTHRGFVSEEFLYDFNQLVLLFWVQTENSERKILKSTNNNNRANV